MPIFAALCCDDRCGDAALHYAIPSFASLFILSSIHAFFAFLFTSSAPPERRYAQSTSLLIPIPKISSERFCSAILCLQNVVRECRGKSPRACESSAEEVKMESGVATARAETRHRPNVDVVIMCREARVDEFEKSCEAKRGVWSRSA